MQLTGRLVTVAGIQSGTLEFAERISKIHYHAVQGPYILPGFIDTHVHGGGGADTMDGAAGVSRLARFHLEHGTTTLYPTTITNPWPAIMAALKGVKELAFTPDLPSIPGVHLEGPFISPQRLGAQPPCTLEPTDELVAELLEPQIIRLVTLAPEIPGALRAARAFAAAGVRVSIGHTAASYEQTIALLSASPEPVGFTHLYNAMSGLSGREPGVVGAALVRPDTYAELILDFHHVHPGSVLIAFNAKKGRLGLVTDAIRACGLGEGTSELGGQRVTIKQGAARLADGTLAGSVLTLDQALRNAVSLGIPLGDVSRLLSANPAAYLGLADRGTLELGKRADIVVLDEELKVLEVYVAGRQVIA